MYIGLEYVCKQHITLQIKYNITLIYIQPGKPTQNANVERFNRTERREWLNMNEFKSVSHMQYVAKMDLDIQKRASKDSV